MGGGARVRAFAPWLLIAAIGASQAHVAAQDAEVPVEAADVASALTLDAPTSCPSTSALESELASLVGRPIEEITLPTGLDPHIVVAADGARFRLEVRDADGVRTLRDRSCSALVRAAALIIALRVDADAATLAAATAAEPEPAPQLVPEPSPVPLDSTPGARRRRGHVYDAFEWSQRLGNPYPRATLPTFSIGGGVDVEGGIVPVATAALAIDTVVRIDRFEARARVAYALEQGQSRSYGIAASAVLGTILGCGRPFEADFAIAFCGGVEAGPLLAHSYGVTVSDQTVAWTVAGVVGVWLPLFPWHGIDISLGVEVWARIFRPEFVVQGLGHLWDSDPFGGRFGFLVHFGS